MRIVITCPNINSIHGGIRILLEWANRLQEFGHDVYVLDQARHLKCKWFPLKARVINNRYLINRADCLIVGSPHGVPFLDMLVKRKFVFIQMMEHYFHPTNHRFTELCQKFYTTPYPAISISQWNIDEMVNKWGRTGPTYYIGNGVNLDMFPIKKPIKDGKTILIESPLTTNPSKDPELLTLKVAQYLQGKGYKIIGYGTKSADLNISEYYLTPNIDVLNDLYSRATILLKATKMDARSCSPMEAMTKGTVTVRGIEFGDDDLTHENSYRCGYNERDLYETALLAMNSPLTAQKADICRQYVQDNSWDFWMPKINQILTQ